MPTTEVPERGQRLARWATRQCELARRHVLQSHLQLAHPHGVRRSGGVEDRLGRHLGAETKTTSGLGPVHFNGGTFGGSDGLRHRFRRRHGLQAKTAGLGDGVEATAEALDEPFLGQTHQGLINGRARTQPCKQGWGERFSSRLGRDALADGL